MFPCTRLPRRVKRCSLCVSRDVSLSVVPTLGQAGFALREQGCFQVPQDVCRWQDVRSA